MMSVSSWSLNPAVCSGVCSMPLKTPAVAVAPWQLVHAGPGPPSAGSRMLGESADGDHEAARRGPLGNAAVAHPHHGERVDERLAVVVARVARRPVVFRGLGDRQRRRTAQICPIFALIVTVPGFRTVIVVPPV